MVVGNGSRLRAYWRVATPTSICSTTRRFSGSSLAIARNVGSGTSSPLAAHARPTKRHLSAPEHDLARDGAGSRGLSLHLMLIALAADRRPIVFEHRLKDLQTRGDGEFHQLGAGIHEEIDEWQMALGEVNRLGPTDRLCETLVSWRLLVGRAFALASHRSYSTTSEEPPLSNFNNYRDNPADGGPIVMRPPPLKPGVRPRQ